MASQQDNEFLNEISYNDTSQNEIEMPSLSNKRVENILRNKRNKNMKGQNTDGWNVRMSTKLPTLNKNEERKGTANGRSSRNQLHVLNKNTTDNNRYIHQTTSSGNLVLYDSIMRASTNSAREMMDQNKISQIHRMFEEQKGEHSDPEDPLQNPKVSGMC